MREGVALGPAFRVAAGDEAADAAEHGVDESRRLVAPRAARGPPDLFHRFVDDGVGGDAVEEQQLKRPEFQDSSQRGLDGTLPPVSAANVAQHQPQGPPVPHRAGGQLVREGPVSGREGQLPEEVMEFVAKKSVPLFDPAERLQGRLAGRSAGA
ncbi:MAG: hypothetical protein NTX87_09130 [Planctomycetota bacterium]|nr:hypothetical protein [Planctomycetota bacterium]